MVTKLGTTGEYDFTERYQFGRQNKKFELDRERDGKFVNLFCTMTMIF